MTDTDQVPEAEAPERADTPVNAHDQRNLTPEQPGEQHPGNGQPASPTPVFPAPGEYREPFPGEFPGEVDEAVDEAAEEEDLLMPGSSGAWAEGAARPAVIRPPAPARRPAGTPTEPEYLDVAGQVGETPPRLAHTLPPQPGTWAGAAGPAPAQDGTAPAAPGAPAAEGGPSGAPLTSVPATTPAPAPTPAAASTPAGSPAAATPGGGTELAAEAVSGQAGAQDGSQGGVPAPAVPAAVPGTAGQDTTPAPTAAQEPAQPAAEATPAPAPVQAPPEQSVPELAAPQQVAAEQAVAEQVVSEQPVPEQAAPPAAPEPAAGDEAAAATAEAGAAPAGEPAAQGPDATAAETAQATPAAGTPAAAPEPAPQPPSEENSGAPQAAAAVAEAGAPAPEAAQATAAATPDPATPAEPTPAPAPPEQAPGQAAAGEGQAPAAPQTAGPAPEAPAAPVPGQPAAPAPRPAVPAQAAPPGQAAGEGGAPAAAIPAQSGPGRAEDAPGAAEFGNAPAAPAAPQAAGPAQAPAPRPAPAYAEQDREAVHRLMRERRDIRHGFRPDPIPHEVLLRVLEAAHTAPSVGLSQPWDFVIIRSQETRQTVHSLALKQRDAYARSLPKARAKQFRELKVEAILDTPVNIVVTADPTRGGRHTLGSLTQPQLAPYSSALAVENLWLAARAEGLGVGWVSFFDERELVRALDLPEHLEIVAYLCVGYVDEFPDEPELAQGGWSQRRPLSWVVHEEAYGRRALPGAEPHDLLSETLAEIRPLDAQALGEAWERQKRMTKPAGALGALEVIGAQLCGLSRSCPPPVPEPAAVAVFAGDHGVHAQGVTPWPQEVTAQMVANFLAGGAVCNAFATQVGAEVCVIDVGVRAELPTTPGLMPRKVRPGTADFTVEPAMSREEVLRAVEVGIETARDLVASGNRALLTGEMGIANTTVSAALIAVFTGAGPAEVTGRGTGVDDETHQRKIEVVRRALGLHQPDPADPIGVLAAVGGLEHAALTGLILGGASLRVPVILDGVSAGAAALTARAIAPEAVSVCIAGHRSAEPGHVAALTALGLRPLVDLDLRLGEGTGALLALPVVQSAARAMREVATFDAAGIADKN